MDAIDWSDGTVTVLDTSQVPGHRTCHVCRDYSDVCEAIRSGIIRGSSSLGIAAAMGIALGAQKSQAKTIEEFDREFEDMCAAMIEAHPGNEDIVSVVRQSRSTYLKYRASSVLLVRIALILEALVLQAERSVSRDVYQGISDEDIQRVCSPSDMFPATFLRGHRFR